jgi:hypothetical protein
MKALSLILVAWVAVAHCGKAKKQIHDQQLINGYEFEYGGDNGGALVGLIESNSHFIEAAPVAVAVAASDHHSSHLARPGYSVGGPLASIAKGQARARAHV